MKKNLLLLLSSTFIFTNILAVTVQVTNNNNSGLGSFREAAGLTTTTEITFNGDYSIPVTGDPPTLNAAFTINVEEHTITFPTAGSTAGLLMANGAAPGTPFFITIAGSGNLNVGVVIGEATPGFAILKTDTGTCNLSSANTYTGGTFIEGGTLALTGPGTLYSTGSVELSNNPNATFDISGATSNITIGTLSSIAGNTINLGANSLTFGQEADTAIAGNVIGSGGSLIKAGSSKVIMTGANTYDGGTVISGGILAIGSGGTLTSTAPVTLNGSSTFDISTGGDLTIGSLTAEAGSAIHFGSNTLTFGTADDTTVAGTLLAASGGTFTFIKQGSGNVTLSAENTLPDKNLLAGGQITLGHNSALGVGDLDMYDTTILGLNDTITIANNLHLTNGSESFDVTSGTAGISGIITSLSGSTSFTKTGAGTLVLSGANTYSGQTVLTAGQITLGNNTGIAATSLTMSAGTTLGLNDTIAANNTISITGGSPVSIDVSSGSGTLSGGISGDAGSSIVKTGAGILNLAGTNTYDGGTAITAGTLTLTGSIDNEGPILMNGSSTFDISGITPASLVIGSLSADAGTTVNLGTKGLTFGTDGDSTIAGIIAGDAGSSFTKTGTGSATLSGVNTFAETTTINEGTLVVNGTLPGAVTVLSSGTLKGIGSIGGLVSVNDGGSLAPGNSIGTITLDSLTLDTGSTTIIEIGPTSASLIDVTGAASLSGTLHINQQTGGYPSSGSYEILTAGSIAGEFLGISENLASFYFTLEYSSDAVTLNYINGIPTSGLTGNLLAFAEYLNTYAPASEEYSALIRSPGPVLNNALYSASPARNAFGPYVTEMTMFSFSHLLNTYLGRARFLHTHDVPLAMTDSLMLNQEDLIAGNYSSGDRYSSYAPEVEHTLWATGFVDFARQESVNQNVPFNFITGGVIAGIDWKNTSESHIVGVGAAYANSDVKDNSNLGSSNISSFAISLYADYFWGAYYMQASVWGMFNHIYNQRIISYADIDTRATSDTNGWQVNPHIEIGFPLGTSGFEVQPYFGFDYVSTWVDSFSEKGAGNLNMRQKDQAFSMIQSEVGVRFFQSVDTCYGLFGVKEGVCYINRTPFDTGTVTAAIFGASEFVTLHSFTKTQNLAAVSASFFAEVGKRREVTISLGYEGEFSSYYTSNQASLTLTKIF